MICVIMKMNKWCGHSSRIIPWTTDVDVVMRPVDMAYINGLNPNDPLNIGDAPTDDNDEDDEEATIPTAAAVARGQTTKPKVKKIVEKRKPMAVLLGSTLQRYMWNKGFAWFHDSIWRMCPRRGGSIALDMFPDYDLTIPGLFPLH
jgi:hypothetical protein